jgi:hypothetical protein
MGLRQLETRNREPPAHAASANDDSFCLKPQPAFTFDRVRVGEVRNASVLVDGHSQGIELRAQGRMCAHIVNDFAHANKQPGIIQYRHTYPNPILTQLLSVADQPGCMG